MNKENFIRTLVNSGIDYNEAKVEVELMFKYFANYTVKDELLGVEIDEDKLKLVQEKVELRGKTRQPVQYITGFANFMGEDFIVNSSVLIPRDETEILVRKSVEVINKYGFTSALDVGTGSGCIACMVAKLTACTVIGSDVSNDALNTALDNASRLNLFNKAIFRKSDIFSKIRDYEKFDVIISNPPYIPLSERKTIQKEVSFEPENALYANDEKGLEFYLKISKEAKNVLNPKGYLLFEVGINQADDVAEILKENGFENIEILQDLAGIDRVVSGCLK